MQGWINVNGFRLKFLEDRPNAFLFVKGLWSILIDSPIKATCDVSLHPIVYPPSEREGSQRCKTTDVHSKIKAQVIATDGYMLLKKPKFIVLRFAFLEKWSMNKI